MFDIGWSEFVVIGIVALIAIGPKELPGVLRGIGQWIGKIRRMANEFQGQFQEALREAELSDLQKQATDITDSITNYNPVADAQKDIEKTFDNPDPFAETAQPAAATDTASAAEPSTDTAGAAPDALPPPAEQVKIDVPLPDEPAQVTEKDFVTTETADAPPPPKQAGGSA